MTLDLLLIGAIAYLAVYAALRAIYRYDETEDEA